MRSFKISLSWQDSAPYIRWARKGTLAVIDQGIFSGSNFVVSVLLARWMSESDYGAFAYGFSVFLFVSGFYNVLLLEPLSIFGPTRHTEHFGPYLARLVVLHVMGAIVIGIGFILFAAVHWLVNVDSKLVPVFLGLSVGHAASLLLWLVRRSYYVEQCIGMALWSTMIYSVLSISGIVALSGGNLLSPSVVFLWMGMAALIASCTMLFFGRHRSQTGASSHISLREVADENWRYGKWLTISALLFWLSGNAYYVLTGTLLTLSEAATLKALQNLTAPVIQVLTATNLLFLPWASRRYFQEGTQALRRDILSLMVFSVGVTAIFFATLIVFESWFFELFYASRYAEGQRFLLQLGLVSTILAVKSAWNISLKIRERTALVSFVDVLGAIFTVTVGIGLVNDFGLSGAVWGLVVSGACSLIILSLIEWHLNRDSAKIRFLSKQR